MDTITAEQALERASAYQQAGRLAEAEDLCRRILAAQPDHPAAWYQLGMVMLAMGRHELAAESLEKAVARQPAMAAYWCDLGVLYRLLGRGEAAAASYRRALAIQPDFVFAYVNLGAVLLTLGELDESIVCYQRALAIQPRDAEAHNNLGNALKEQGRREEAMASFRTAVEIYPDYPAAHYNLGTLHLEMEQGENAIGSLRRALALRPDFPEALDRLGVALSKAGQSSEAVSCLRRALALKPQYTKASIDLGYILSAENQLEEAIECYQQALRFGDDSAAVHSNLGASYLRMGRLDEAIRSCERAIALQPDFAEAFANLGVACVRKGRFHEAQHYCRRAIALRNDLPAPHLNLGLMLLLHGQYDEGWREHEWRLPELASNSSSGSVHGTRWDGTSVKGETMLVSAEQGFGDVLQFVRYLPLVKPAADAGRVVFACPPELVRLFADSDGWNAEIVAHAVAGGAALPAIGQRIPLLSLPLALGLSEPLGMKAPYLQAHLPRRAAWRERLAPGSGLRIGLAWQGNPVHTGDCDRSIAPPALLSVVRLAGVTCYSLQVGPSRDVAGPLPEAGLIDHTPHIADFADTAALMMELDLIITVDTATAHLAGALGRPVWTLLPFVPDWRWGLEREDTPWYPTMRLFRQEWPGDWVGVIRRVTEELPARCGRVQ